MWRTILAANDYNKLQYTRKNLIEINIVIIVFCFIIGGNDNDSSNTMHQNFVMKLTSNCLFWFFAGSCQTLGRFLWYERYFSEPKGQRFIDLCSLAKVSVIIMDDLFHGYYLHCRAPYETADCSMDTVYNEMVKEGIGLTVDRGFSTHGTPDNSQAFELFATDTFSTQFRKVGIACKRSTFFSF